MAAPAPRAVVYKRPYIYPKQFDALFLPVRFAICEASTKCGKTHGCIVWLFEQAAMGQAGQNFWWVAPVYAQAKIAFRRMKRALPSALYTPNETELTITLLNGAVIWFKSAEKEDNLYGEDVYAAVFDEATRAKEAAWVALQSTLTATGGDVRVIGNVKGKRNWVARLAQRARDEMRDKGAASRYHYSKLTAYDAIEAGILDAQVVEEARQNMTEAAFRELYLAEPSDDGGNPFGLQHIARQVMKGAVLGSDGTVRLNGTALPAPVRWGIDPAKHQDFFVCVGLDAQNRVTRLHRWQGADWEAAVQRVIGIVGRTPGLIDATHGSVGDPLSTFIRSGGAKGIQDFKFTGTSKQPLMEGLALAVQQGSVWFPEGVLLEELEAFEYEYTRAGGVKYAAPEGMHDDCVCALAMAVKSAQTPAHVAKAVMYDD